MNNPFQHVRIDLSDLQSYYQSCHASREARFKERLGNDLNWALSFDQYKEAETTKHVHRLHPYKGKFIPQLAEYFLDGHTDSFKPETYFAQGDIILDPFSGCGTTMVQACELGMYAIGIDVAAFNALMGNCKVAKYDIDDVQSEIDRITELLNDTVKDSYIVKFERQLALELQQFNKRYFPAPDYQRQLRSSEIDEKEYGANKERQFLPL